MLTQLSLIKIFSAYLCDWIMFNTIQNTLAHILSKYAGQKQERPGKDPHRQTGEYVRHVMSHLQGWGQIRFIKYKYKYKYIFFRSFKYKYKYKYTGKNLIKYKYKYKYSSSNTNTNTQWGRDKIAAILQMTYWNLLYCKKIVYTFKFHWKLFPKVQSTISLHWFR